MSPIQFPHIVSITCLTYSVSVIQFLHTCSISHSVSKCHQLTLTVFLPSVIHMDSFISTVPLHRVLPFGLYARHASSLSTQCYPIRSPSPVSPIQSLYLVSPHLIHPVSLSWSLYPMSTVHVPSLPHVYCACTLSTPCLRGGGGEGGGGKKILYCK